MSTAVEHLPAGPVQVSLTDYQILKALQLSDSGTWLLSRMAWHLMVHATTVTLSVERLETKLLVKRHSHPHDRRATLVSITDEGRELADEATHALSEIEVRASRPCSVAGAVVGGDDRASSRRRGRRRPGVRVGTQRPRLIDRVTLR